MNEGAAPSVLLVDDEHAIVEALGELLAWDGYAVRSAPDGKAGLEALRASPADVVMLDLMMPGMDGLQVTAALRADPALRHVGIVLMSAAPIPERSDPDWDATLHKPFGLTELREVLARVLRLRPPAPRRCVTPS